MLHRLLAIRTQHGDFRWYHEKFQHEDANLDCTCGKPKSPSHIVSCRKTRRLFHLWPQPPRLATQPAPTIPVHKQDKMKYLGWLIQTPTAFSDFLRVTEFYSKICPR